MSRFNVFLSSGGRFTLPGPDPSRLPTGVPGQYLIPLRIEASDDGLNSSDLSAVGAGASVVNSGGAAGFPLPVLRFVVGGGDNSQSATDGNVFHSLTPIDGTTLPINQIVEFTWSAAPGAHLYRLEIEDQSQNVILAAVPKSDVWAYRPPSWLKEKDGNGNLRWRVVALDQQGKRISATEARTFRFAK